MSRRGLNSKQQQNQFSPKIKLWFLGHPLKII
jgi:hypothetical protein